MDAPAPQDAARKGLAGLALTGLGMAAFLSLSLLGPSAAQPDLGPGGGPPWSFDAGLPPRLAVALLAAGIVLSGCGTGVCLLAARRGWRPPTGPLVAAGAVLALAFSVTPPVGSSDHLNYAAYGHMAVNGMDPYLTSAADIAGDAYGRAVQEWRTTPSVYGPLVTWTQAFAAWVGGGSVRTTVLVLSLINGLVFVGVGLVLRRRARDAAGRLRAALLWSLNPLLLFQLVSGAHNDVLGIGAAVLALALFTGGPSTTVRAFGTGALTGAAVAMKLPAGLVGGGPAWRLVRAGRFREVAALFGGAALVVGAAYAVVGLGAFAQIRQAAGFISLASPWHLLAGSGGGVLDLDLDKQIVSVASLVLLAWLVRLLTQALPGGPEDEALRVAAALVLAWLFAAPYALPWYDGLGWAALALLPMSRFDGLLLARTVALSLAYLPARDPALAGLPSNLHWLVTGLRSEIMPFVLTAVLGALIWTCLRPPRPAPALGRRRPAPAAPPG